MVFKISTVHFNYQTELVFSAPASDHRFRLKILPQSDGRQNVKELSLSVEPEGVTWRTVDGFGNEVLSGFINEPHGSFRFGIEGTAEISDSPYTEYERYERILLYHTELTKPLGGIADFYNTLSKSAPDDVLQRVNCFSHAVHNHMKYERGVTTPLTTASEAFDSGAGVCQDYAHILLALLRLDGIPCGYIAGLASDCGETHAWVEAFVNGECYGIDPTRDKFIDGGYIALSRGRDFEDCSVERGVYKGNCLGTQTINLQMEIV